MRYVLCLVSTKPSSAKLTIALAKAFYWSITATLSIAFVSYALGGSDMLYINLDWNCIFDVIIGVILYRVIDYLLVLASRAMVKVYRAAMKKKV